MSGLCLNSQKCVHQHDTLCNAHNYPFSQCWLAVFVHKVLTCVTVDGDPDPGPEEAMKGAGHLNPAYAYNALPFMTVVCKTLTEKTFLEFGKKCGWTITLTCHNGPLYGPDLSWDNVIHMHDCTTLGEVANSYVCLDVSPCLCIVTLQRSSMQSSEMYRTLTMNEGKL